MQTILLFIFYLQPKNSKRQFFLLLLEREKKEEKEKIFSLLCQVSSKLSRIIHALLLHNSCSRQLHRSYEKKLQKKNRLFISGKGERKKKCWEVSLDVAILQKSDTFFFFVSFVFTNPRSTFLVSREISFPGRDYF